MPLIEIVVSPILSAVEETQIIRDAISDVSKVIDKPEVRFMSTVRSGAQITCAADATEPAGYIKVSGLPGFTPEINGKVAAVMTRLLQRVGVPPGRLVITFTEHHTTHWARAGNTYATQWPT